MKRYQETFRPKESLSGGGGAVVSQTLSIFLSVVLFINLQGIVSYRMLIGKSFDST
jgi:hypothetical protein